MENPVGRLMPTASFLHDIGNIVHDVLHRQITNVHGKRLLLRKMEQTRREGSRHGWASHGTRSAPSTGTA